MLDISKLEAPLVCEKIEYEDVLAEIRDDFKKYMPELEFLESDPIYKNMQAYAYRETILTEKINAAARAMWLPWAWGKYLDEIGRSRGVLRKDNESDDEYRERIRLSGDVAMAGQFGSESHYKAFIVGMEGISDAKVLVESEESNLISVIVLGKPSYVYKDKKLVSSEPGVLPETKIAEVTTVVNKEKIKALNHKVSVRAGSIKEYKITVKIVVDKNDPTRPDFDALKLSVNEWVKNNHRLGKIVSVSSLANILHKAAIVSARIIEPKEDILPKLYEAGFCRFENIYISEVEEREFYGGNT